jgi:hypothetical protein
MDRDTWKGIARVLDVVDLTGNVFWIAVSFVGLLLHH